METGETKLNHFGPIVLVTGFGPFAEYEINPSQLITENLNGSVINGATIVGIILPVNYTSSVKLVNQAIEDYNPILVVSTGLAAGSSVIRIEKIGINLRFGEKRFNLCRIDPNGPLFHLSAFPSNCLVKNIKRAGIPARTSFFAGIYICNAVLYGVIDYIKDNNLYIKSGFIHVPLLSSQHPEGMDFEKMLNAITIIIQECLNN
jgi:pyroglutamyl-peptidase